MTHAVTVQMPPCPIDDGRLVVHQVRAWTDNFSWLLSCPDTGEAAVVDGPEAKPVLDYCAAQGLRLTTILNTHTHRDHIGINLELSEMGVLNQYRVWGCSSRASDIPGLTRGVNEGDAVTIGKSTAQVWLTEGHIDGHLSFVFKDAVFCGDTLFAGGCGYLFDGPPEKMQSSLARLATLPQETQVFCAHEYTQDNLRFAWSVDSGNSALAERIRRVWAVRATGGSTVPSTIEEERSTNPFMGWSRLSLQEAARAYRPTINPREPAEVFAALRALKDSKAYRELSEGDLPL